MTRSGITIWGPPATGKTTFLAALDHALAVSQSGWRVRGMDQVSTNALVDLTNSLVGRGEFPPATVATTSYEWALVKTVRGPWWRSLFGLRPRYRGVEVPLQLVDTPGSSASPADPAVRELAARIARSAGIIFIFDPTREFEVGDAYEHTYAMLTQLDHLSNLEAGKLPHYLAVCVAKFDDARVYDSAVAARLVEYDTERCDAPYVDEHFAETFFTVMCQISRHPAAHTLRDTLAQRFSSPRTRFFVTSAIGFFIDPQRGRFDPKDFVNVDEQGGTARVRGQITPVGVVESVVWLAERLARDAGE